MLWLARSLLKWRVTGSTPPYRHVDEHNSWLTERCLPLTGLSSLGVPGVPWHTKILADQLTLFQPGGTDYPHLISTGTAGFLDHPTALINTPQMGGGCPICRYFSNFCEINEVCMIIIKNKLDFMIFISIFQLHTVFENILDNWI